MFEVLPTEILNTYLQRRQNDLEQLKQSLRERSVEAFNRIGHQIKGNAKSYGFDNLEPIGIEMEKLCLENLETVGLQLIEKLDHSIKENIIALKDRPYVPKDY
ncbi:MAG: Hpt domain-containing protein [Pseudobdellovibrio sp.]